MSRYSQLCPVYFGPGEVNNTGAIAKELGMTNVLLVTEKAIAETGIPGRVMDSLLQSGIKVSIFDGVKMDAPDTTVMEGAELAESVGADAVIGCGGGSSLDTAKGIALYVTNKKSVTIKKMIHFDPTNPLILAPALKTIMIPTTSGTGSESTFVAVITDTETHQKCGCIVWANAAIVDPDLTLGLGKTITAYTGMDAFSHCNECLCNVMPNPHSDTLALSSMERIYNWLPVAVNDPNCKEARYHLAIASNFAGIAFQDSQVNVGHAMAHALGARLHIPHGIGCALVTPSVIELVAAARPEIYGKVAEIFELEITSVEELPTKLADAVRSFNRRIGIPSMKDLGFTREQVLSTVTYALGEMMRMGCIVPQDEAVLADMMAKVYDNYQ
ncbi:iron-containing alcohol dehydrogenase [Lacrimispora sp.]|uniref:iron-containing alcohol dehydrogenase n=1 Tax=Lacrimispora sp. TaxID=2719234 RepID=UPI0032E41F02